MSVSVIQVEGFYVSSSLPKALFIPEPYSDQKRKHLKHNLRLNKKNAKVLSCKDINKPVSGRQHLAVQTELYIEELCDVITEVDVQCETDPVQHIPPLPVFVPQKSGDDVETQILPGELFDFDLEVQPVLENLVCQTLEESLIELMAEDDLAALEALKKGYEMKRDAELVEIRKLEEEEREYLKEKQKKLEEQDERIRLENEVAQKIAACVYSQSYLKDLVPEVYKKLEEEGYFESEEEEEAFWPWLVDEVDSEIASLEASSQLLDGLIEDTAQSVKETAIIQPINSDNNESVLDSHEEMENDQQQSHATDDKDE